MAAHIVLVDDNAATLEGLAELLTDAGYSTVAVGTFEEAKHVLEEATPDLLIVDIRLGAYNGLQLAVRERLTHPECAIIATTGYPDSVLEAEARSFGAEYMEKPIRGEELLGTVKRLLKPIGPRG
jgi:DNA-binding response OmpR family regulator